MVCGEGEYEPKYLERIAAKISSFSMVLFIGCASGKTTSEDWALTLLYDMVYSIATSHHISCYYSNISDTHTIVTIQA